MLGETKERFNGTLTLKIAIVDSNPFKESRWCFVLIKNETESEKKCFD